MNTKKFAIYVEGQTEQVLLNHLLRTHWNYSGIIIENIKLHASQNTTCKVQDYSTEVRQEEVTFFLIMDVDGVGSLTSAIANREKKQNLEGFEIIGLRDLSAADFNELPENLNRMDILIQKFKEALEVKGCVDLEKIDLFFAIMTIEAWLLAFNSALSRWARISERDANKHTENRSLEEIRSPSSVLKKLGNAVGRGNPKSFKEVTSFVSNITGDEIKQVRREERVPSFNLFWDRITRHLQQNGS